MLNLFPHTLRSGHRTSWQTWVLILCFLSGGIHELVASTKQLDSLEAILALEPSDTIRVHLHQKLAYQWRAHDVGRSKHHSRKLIQLGFALGDTLNATIGMRGLAKTYRAVQQYDSAQLVFQQLLEHWTLTKDTAKMLTISNDLAWLALKQGNYQEAIAEGMEILALNTPMKSATALARTEALLGVAYRLSVTQLYDTPFPAEAKERLEQACIHLERSVDLNIQLNRQYSRSAATSLGNLYADLERYTEALAAYDLADSLYTVFRPNETSRKILQMNRALVYLDLKRFSDAQRFFKSNVKYFEEAENVDLKARFFFNYFLVEEEQQHSRKALSCIQSAVYWAKQADNLVMLQQYSENLAKAYIEVGDFTNSALVSQEVVQLTDSLNQLELRKKADELIALHQSELSKKEIQRLQLENQLTNLENLRKTGRLRQQQIGLAVAIFVILLLAGCIVAVYQRSQARQALTQEKLIAGANELEWLRANLTAELKTGEPVFAFDLESRKVNNYLLAPLTERELDVLALLSEGLSNRAISERLCISPNTAKTHIARIYDKLDVNNRTQAARKASSLRLLHHLEKEKT